MKKILCVTLFNIIFTFVIFANDTVDQLIKSTNAEEDYKLEVIKIIKNLSFDIKPHPDQGEQLQIAAQEANRKKHKLIKDTFSWSAMRYNLEHAYIQTYSQEELEYLLVVNSTEIGKSIMKKSNLFNENYMKLIMEDYKVFQEKSVGIRAEYEIVYKEYLSGLKLNH